jgi:hypothetical protein
MTHDEAFGVYKALGQINPEILTPAFIRDMTEVRQILKEPALRVQEEMEAHRERVMEEGQESPRPEQISEIEDAMQETLEEPIEKDVPTIDPRGVTSTKAMMALLEIEELEPVWPPRFVNGQH